MYKGKKVSVIIAAAGSARRMRGTDKIFMDLGGCPVLARTVRNFESDPSVDEIVIAVREDQIQRCRQEIVRKYDFRKVTAIVAGGNERTVTVGRAVSGLSPKTDIILIQDGARPFSDQGITARVLEAVCGSGAAVPAVPVNDTIKMITGDEDHLMVDFTPRRDRMRAVQTPQGFKAELIRRAYRISEDPDEIRKTAGADSVTDDSSLVEQMGVPVRVVEGNRNNIKITTPEDVEKAEWILAGSVSSPAEESAEEAAAGCGVKDYSDLPPDSPPGYEARPGREADRKTDRLPDGIPRTGIGFDVHAFAEGRRLILGGVDIPHEKGLAGHSDADVLVHAVMDALLGACALRDIGYYFPDSDPAYSGADSLMLLSRVKDILKQNSWRVVNVDSVIIAQEPKLAPYIEQMKENIAAALGIPADAVGVKATTTERLGFPGRKEGIAAQASAAVVRG